MVQLYVKDLAASVTVPHHSLRGFQRVHLTAGETERVTFEVASRDLMLIDERGRRVLEPGRFRASIGSSQPDERSVELVGRAPVTIEFEVVEAPPATDQ